ncbi:hypothetical protein [Desulfobacter latus]|uniref:Uncharacterized protein n=1 Tax=Desulfobacter latus TaxID=2292 RepID=A0A850T4F6_9BACT|nr:hypothetical protein [Desulfobacter latus]NWH04132.1 hypothetical protein [Desulfobacter latus]
MSVNLFESLSAIEQQNCFYIATIIQKSQFGLLSDQTMNKKKKEIAGYATEHQIHFYEAVPQDRETVHNFNPIQGPHGRNTSAV